MSEYTLVIERQFRRSIKIQVLADKTVKVTAPRLIPKLMIDSFLKQKERWIQKRLLQPQAPSWKDKSSLTYLGQHYEIHFIEQKKPEVKFEGTNLVIASLSPQKTLVHWFRKRAYDVLEDRVYHFAKQMNVQPQDIRVKTMKTRWGSCSSKGNLNFNWTLVMAPLSVLDYVVIHELAHLKHMNHSKAFWAFVKQHCPEYKIYIKWLKDNTSALSYH